MYVRARRELRESVACTAHARKRDIFRMLAAWIVHEGVACYISMATEHHYGYGASLYHAAPLANVEREKRRCMVSRKKRRTAGTIGPSWPFS